MKVLVGVDGSSNSFAAVAFVGRLLSPNDDELVLLFAAPAVSFEDERLDPAVEERARSSFSRAILDAALERLPESWQRRAEPREVVGQPGAALLTAADDFGAELIAVGFRGTSSLMEQFMLGSVSRTVVDHGPPLALRLAPSAHVDRDVGVAVLLVEPRLRGHEHPGLVVRRHRHDRGRGSLFPPR